MLTNFSQFEDKQVVHTREHKHKHKHKHNKHINEIKSKQIDIFECLPPRCINNSSHVNMVILEEIVHQCPTGFGDCVTGYVSSYLFKKKLEKRFHKILKLSIDWSGVTCPYINQQHIYKGDIPTSNKAIVVCFYAGPDGTASFNRYYCSEQLLEDVSHKTHLMLTINQFVGRCFIDTDTSREEIKIWTYEAYKYFWEEVLNQCFIMDHIGALNYDYQEMALIYVRLGDQYLCEKCNGTQQLTEYYSQINANDLQNKQIVLIGDSENNVLIEVFNKIHNNANIVQLTGTVVHSCGNLGTDDWIKIFTDLYLLLRSKTVYILSNNSNFVRIVLFLKNVTSEQIYFMVGNKLTLLDDLSIVFAKHYQF
jgi:hypothetical protein